LSLITESLNILSKQHFDCLAVGVIDFKKNKFKSFEITDYENVNEKPRLYFDLASVTKPLTNSAVYLSNPSLFDKDMLLLLNHKAGLPMGGRLSNYNWRSFLSEYKIIESETLYSDYSSLRCMIEIEKKSGKRLKELCNYYFDKELVYWLDLDPSCQSPITGWRNHKLVSGEVHDDNCFVIKDFISHAGLFATVDGLAKSLINLNNKQDLLNVMSKNFESQKENDRYIFGFDRPMDLNNTLAGKGCSIKTFGHLGFTGTSFWIDIEKMKGAIILSNATRSYWYDRNGLSEMRKFLGELIWKEEVN
jgi:hypothetical protein